jgi:hypothetical protein
MDRVVKKSSPTQRTIFSVELEGSEEAPVQRR